MKQLSADAETLQAMDVRSVRAPVDPDASFSSADDDDIAAALASRVDGGSAEPDDDEAPLTGVAHCALHAVAIAAFTESINAQATIN